MTTTLFFVRHGETDFNRASIMQGRRVNSSLNELGRQQAAALALRLANTRIDAIYTSTLARAQETAHAVADLHPAAKLVALEDLEEMSWGIHDGSAPGADIQQAYRRWRNGDYAHAVEHGESILDVQARALRALDRILRAEEGRCVLVVTHGRFLRVLLASVLDEYGLARMDDIPHSNTGVNHLEHDGTRFRVRRLNCTTHLHVCNGVSLN